MPKIPRAIIEVPDIGARHVLRDTREKRFMGLDSTMRETTNRYEEFLKKIITPTQHCKAKTKADTKAIIIDVKKAMSQSEFKTITCSRQQAQENTRVEVTIGFTSHWMRKEREFY